VICKTEYVSLLGVHNTDLDIEIYHRQSSK